MQYGEHLLAESCGVARQPQVRYAIPDRVQAKQVTVRFHSTPAASNMQRLSIAPTYGAPNSVAASSSAAMSQDETDESTWIRKPPSSPCSAVCSMHTAT
jgi:hypothetical protein